MEIRKAEIGDEEILAKQFWHPLAKQMEDYHPANKLKEDAAEEGVGEFRERIENNKYSFYFLEDDEMEIGYISIEKGDRVSRKLDKYIEILGLYVKKGFRGQGYGTKLIEKAREIAKDLEADYITVSAEWKNEEARKFYKEKGFEEKQVEFVQVV